MFCRVSEKMQPRKICAIRKNGLQGLVELLPVFALLVFAAGCASPVVKADVLMPGRFSEPAQIKSVAVLPFDGPDGMEYAAMIEAKLASIIIDDKQYFQLVDRKVLDKLLDEMGHGMSGLVDANKAAQVGKFAGAKGIYTGTVSVSSVYDSAYAEKRTKCDYYVDKTNSKGNTYKECGKTSEYTVDCSRRTASFSVTPKLIDVETSRIVYSNLLEGTVTDSQCRDSGKSLRGSQAMKREAQDQTTAKFREDVAPFFVTLEITLKDSTSGIESKDAKEKLKSGLEFAKNNRLDRGCEIWSDARSFAPNSITYLYNLGVCAEVKGKLEGALSLYKQADKQLNKPDNQISVALSRVGEAIEKQKKLGQQMLAK